MVFNNIKETSFVTCLNTKSTIEKKVIIPRVLGNEINKIISVFNKYNPNLRLDNSLLYEICLTDLISELDEAGDTEAIAILSEKVLKRVEFKNEDK